MRRAFFTATCLGLVAGLFHCGSADVSCVDLGNCTGERPGDGGGGGEGGFDVVAPPGCDLTKSPKESAACVDDAVGVFVSATGDDGATGAKATPVKSVARGVEIAASKGLPRVYVCEGSYDKAVEIKAPVSVYGGFACAGWTYSGAKPKLAPAKGIALKVMKVTGAVLVEDFEIVGSADAAVPGDSAIGVFVSESGSTVLRNVSASAGAGTAGAPGTTASNWTGAATPGTPAANGGAAVNCACLDAKSSSTGGKGGAIGVGGDDGSAVPAVGTPNGGGGGSNCQPGFQGANGLGGSGGAASTGSGALSTSGWNSQSTAKAGANGNPGQGGGGGGGRTGVTGGGGGGCGGCGGAGGTAGGNGGSSFAILVMNSSLSLEGGTIVTAAAGAGGKGGSGQTGQSGAAGAPGACDGGEGGAGAGGSGGGGGAGGHSAPIAFVGTEPKVTGATLTPGAKGAVGAGGDPGAGPGNAGAPGTPGPEGKSQSVLAL